MNKIKTIYENVNGLCCSSHYLLIVFFFCLKSTSILLIFIRQWAPKLRPTTLYFDNLREKKTTKKRTNKNVQSVRQ